MRVHIYVIGKREIAEWCLVWLISGFLWGCQLEVRWMCAMHWEHISAASCFDYDCKLRLGNIKKRVIVDRKDSLPRKKSKEQFFL